MKGKNLLSGNVYTALIFLAVPIMLNNLLQTFYNLTDTYWLGRLGADSMAAITVVSPIQGVITSFGGGITGGGSVVLSQCFGGGNLKKCVQTANQIFFAMTAFSLLAAAIMLLGSGVMMRGMGAEGNVYSSAVVYMRIMAADIPLIFMINIYTAVHNAAGKTGKPLALNFIGTVINMFLDPLFLVVFKWGAAGAALATVLAKLPCALAALLLMTKKDNPVRITPLHIHIQKETMLRIIKTGLPMGIGNSAMSFGFALMSKNVLSYGTAVTAAYGIGNKLNGIVSTPSAAMGNAVSIMSGQTKGAGLHKRGARAMAAGMVMMVGLLAVTGFIISRQTIARATAGIFSSDASVIAHGAQFLGIMAAMSWTNGIYDSARGYLNGQGKTLSTVLVNAARLWLFRFAVLYFCQYVLKMGAESIWYAVTLSNALAAAIMGITAVTAVRRRLKAV